MKFLFLMDPLESLVMEKDTTFMLMLGAHRRGHEVYYLPEDGIALKGGQVFFHVIKVIPQMIAHQPFQEEHALTLTQNQVHAVFIRTDPPFDEQYLMNTWQLDRLPKRIAVLNNPAGVRTVNEKIWATQFISLVPPTIVSSNRHDILNFIQEQKNVIAKPTNGHGGKSVFHIEGSHTNTNVILETLTQNWTNKIIVQSYIPESKNGDKRVLLLNGEPLGAVLRVHAEGEHRNNFYAGGKPAAATLTARDQKIIETLKPHLRELGLHFVGIDILGDYLIEVNVTSPTGLQEMNRLYNTALEEKVIDFAEHLCN